MKKLMIAVAVGAALFALRSSQPRGIRNNNPLNIREPKNGGDQWQGEALGNWDADFEEFESPLMGIRAAARLLRNYRDNYGLDNIQGIISRWAPTNENDTDSYIKSVAAKVGKAAYAPLSADDYPKLIEAMIYHENGQQPYSYELIKQGFEAGFYS